MNKKGQAVTLGNAPSIVLLLILVVMIAASGAVALTSMASTQCQYTYSATLGCLNSTGGTGGNRGYTYSYNITNRGEQAVDNFSKQTPTIGTIVGVALIIVVVVGAFAFFAMRGSGL